MADHKSALLIIDMLNTLDFPQGEQLLRQAKPIAVQISKLKKRMKNLGFPVIYVNDNFGHWKSDWRKVYEICVHKNARGCQLAQILKPEEDDYFILKPKHSGFYSTPLNLLLEELKVKRLVIVGIAGNICVLFTAHEAHMRGFKVVVPRDCTASNNRADNDYAIEQLSKNFRISTSNSRNLRF